jgi:hypothetical protein
MKLVRGAIMKILEVGEQESKEGEQVFCSSATTYQCHISKIPQAAVASRFGAPANVSGPQATSCLHEATVKGQVNSCFSV